MERRERIVVNIHTTGYTLDSILATAIKNLDGFFGDYKYEILEFRATPATIVFGGSIIMWAADIEAGEIRDEDESS